MSGSPKSLYDKEYVAKRTAGFDKWSDYILGKEDGDSQDARMAGEGDRSPGQRHSRAGARVGKQKGPTLPPGGLIGFGGACRTATGTDWARGMVCLMAMQGLGKPGVNMGCLQQGTPVDTRFFFPGYSEGGFSGDLTGTACRHEHVPAACRMMPTMNTVQQAVPRLKIPEAIMEGKCEGYPTDPRTDRRAVLEVPVPGPRAFAGQALLQVRRLALWHHVRDQPLCQMYRTDKLECVINQSIWMEGEAKFADVILPACTNFERWDISEFANCGGYVHHAFTQCNHRVAVHAAQVH